MNPKEQLLAELNALKWTAVSGGITAYVVTPNVDELAMKIVMFLGVSMGSSGKGPVAETSGAHTIMFRTEDLPRLAQAGLALPGNDRMKTTGSPSR